MKILILNGPNLNLLGKREPEIYGDLNLDGIVKLIERSFPALIFEHYQSNHEGKLIDKIQETDADGIVFNPAAFTHYSYALSDAVKAIDSPVIEVHLSDIHNREEFRKISVIAENCIDQISGFGHESYIKGINALLTILSPNVTR